MIQYVGQYNVRDDLKDEHREWIETRAPELLALIPQIVEARFYGSTDVGHDGWQWTTIWSLESYAAFEAAQQLPATSTLMQEMMAFLPEPRAHNVRSKMVSYAFVAKGAA